MKSRALWTNEIALRSNISQSPQGIQNGNRTKNYIVNGEIRPISTLNPFLHKTTAEALFFNNASAVSYLLVA
jgi:hypothetical protein